MNAYVIVLRILHIGGGVFWAGALFVIVWFLVPTGRAVGPAAGPFMGHLMGAARFPQIASGVGLVTILSGALLYWHDFGEIIPFNAPMAGFAVGAVAAITLWIVGTFAFAPANRRLGALGARAAQGEDVGAEIGRITASRDRLIPLMTTLLLVAIGAMAISRYL
ncbi:MAG: hypothetical protein WD895_02020 [Acidimicrobiia bacterium]